MQKVASPVRSQEPTNQDVDPMKRCLHYLAGWGGGGGYYSQVRVTVVFLLSNRTNVIEGDYASKSRWFSERVFILLIMFAMCFPLHLTVNATSAFVMLGEMGEGMIDWNRV